MRICMIFQNTPVTIVSTFYTIALSLCSKGVQTVLGITNDQNF